MFEIVKETLQYGKHRLSIETGRVARQADAAVLVDMDDTVVLATVVAKKTQQEGQDFFPMSVDYVEKSYAAGRFPGGFFKREGRPTERETLIARLIDRPLRPLFPKGFYHEVQIVVTVMSLNPEVDPDIPSIIAASAALSLSGIPFLGPIAAARVGYIDGELQLNPSPAELQRSSLNLVLSAGQTGILMVESEASELPESLMLEALQFGYATQQAVVNLINSLVEKAGKPRWDWTPVTFPEALLSKVHALAYASLEEAYAITQKQLRSESLSSLKKGVVETILGDEDFSGQVTASQVEDILFDLECQIVRGNILSGRPRIDGRDTRTVRPISIQVGVLPRTHGSALFTRGETQSLCVATLGTESDAQIIDGLMNESKEHFMLHYNMPPYATGEVGRVTGPKRREIGHGRLAKRALLPLLPTKDDFPYTIRVVSEITESNGSSSMASVCAGCLSLMDAGVPIKSHVAGIAMGLIKDDQKFAVLSDILGDEDHLGDIDFKVAGTTTGVTALQMDIKVTGVGFEILGVALEQAREARLHILEIMHVAIASSRQDVSQFAPRIISMRVNPDKIHAIIGRSGSTIKALTEETFSSIDIQEDGTVLISSSVPGAVELAQKRIEQLTMEIKIGGTYEGTVTKLLDFGAIVDIMSTGRDGLLHVSKLRDCRQKCIRDVLSEGQVLTVQIVDMDEKGRIRLGLASDL